MLLLLVLTILLLFFSCSVDDSVAHGKVVSDSSSHHFTELVAYQPEPKIDNN